MRTDYETRNRTAAVQIRNARHKPMLKTANLTLTYHLSQPTRSSGKFGSRWSTIEARIDLNLSSDGIGAKSAYPARTRSKPWPARRKASSAAPGVPVARSGAEGTRGGGAHGLRRPPRTSDPAIPLSPKPRKHRPGDGYERGGYWLEYERPATRSRRTNVAHAVPSKD